MYDFENNKFSRLAKFFWWRNTEQNLGIPNKFSKEKYPEVDLASYDIIQNLKEVYRDLNQIKDFYLTDTIMNRIIEDALNPFGDNDLFKITVKDYENNVIETLTDELLFFQKEFNLDDLILSNAKDILLFGNFILKLNFDDNNLIEIDDNVDFTNIIPNVKNGNIIDYVELNEEKEEITRVPAFNYVYFGYNYSKKRVKLKHSGKLYYFRVSEGLFNSVLENMKNLMMLEKLVSVNLLKISTSQKIYSVSVPEKMNPDEVKNAIKNYEKVLNENFNTINFDFKNVNNIIKQILEKTNIIKVMPNWGDKGQVEKVDMNLTDSFDFLYEKISDLRNVIVKSLGFSEDFFENTQGRSDFFQNTIRYTRKLKMFQKSLENGIRELCYIYLSNKGYKVLKNNISVTFSNSINLSDLEELEYINSMLALTSDIKSSLDDAKDIAEDDDNIEIDIKSLIKIYNNIYNKSFKVNELLKYKEEDEEE